jgi:glucose/arabinose dehydrogenase
MKELFESVRQPATVRAVNTAPLSRHCLVIWIAVALALVLGILSDARASEPLPAVGLKLVAEDFVSPLNLIVLPDGSGRQLIADQVGTVHVLGKDGKVSEQLFLDLRSKQVELTKGFDERGLLGLAMHPKFQQNRKLYVFYSAPPRPTAPTNFTDKARCTSRLSEFKVSASDATKADVDSERVLLEIDKPQMNHNCGRITFGPDGLLYVGTGDGGGANDNEVGHPGPGNGQNTRTLLAKILRIDVDGPAPYGIPRDNPFADGKDGLPEIYSWGWRNPWGISFDMGGTHELFAVDVGQNLYEELNIVVKGGNYGWRTRESFHGFDPASANKSPENAPTTDSTGKAFIDPVVEYPHPPRNKPPSQTEPQGISVTGGYVYRGKSIPGLQGRYVFADWSRSWALPDGVVFVATRPAIKTGKWSLEYLPLVEPAKLGAYIVAFGQDQDGEIYVLTNARNGLIGKFGKVYKLVPM